MVKKNSRPERDREAPEDVLTDMEVDALAAKEAEIEEWVSDFQGRFSDQPVKVQVEKYDSGEWGICRKYPLESFDHMAVFEEYGGGRYRATLFGPDGKYVKGGRHEFKFATPLKPAAPVQEKVNPLADPIVMMMMENFKQQNAANLELMKAMLSGNSNKSSELPSVLEAMKVIGVLAPKENGFKQFQEFMTMASSMKDFMGIDDKRDTGGEGGLMSDIKEFMSLYPAIKEALPQIRAGASPGGVVPPNPPPPERKAPQMSPVSQKIAAHIPTILEAAKTNQPVEKWADFVGQILDVEIMPLLVPEMIAKYKPFVKDEDDVYNGLLEKSKDPDEREKIFKAIPPLAPYREWVGRVLDAWAASNFETIPLAEAPAGVNGTSTEGE